MVLNAAVQMLREADELKLTILNFKNGTSMLQERSLWVTQQQLQKVYQKVLVLDLDYALDKKVEQDLWNVGFKQQIEALQAISKDRKNPLRSEGQAMLSWVLQAAAGFYLCLLHQICTTFKLDLPFRRRASLLGWVEGWGAGEAASGARLPPPAAARYICQHCLVHLGDLARYRQQLRVAHTFYRHALVVSAHSGQPYNQLALVAWRRGRRLGALYWHVRSLLVRSPFPPAPANLARTLQAAASRDNKDLPVLPGVTSVGVTNVTIEQSPTPAPTRLDAHSYVTELIRALHLIHTVEELDKAAALVDSLNSSLTALVATDSFESMTLIKMACVIIWLVHSCTEELTIESTALSESEAVAAQLSESLAAAALLALLLPAYTADEPPQRTLPALKVWLQWVVSHPCVPERAAWAARPQLWPAVAHALNKLAPRAHRLHNQLYETVPLVEDEELHGFLPLEQELKDLQFSSHAAWETYGGQLPDEQNGHEGHEPLSDVTTCLSNDPELEHKVRAYRLVQLGKRLAELCPEHLSYNEEDGSITFTATAIGGEQLSRALAELSLARGEGQGQGDALDEEDSEEEPSPPPPPIVISEADFKEKVREKRVGILKPQGSLERAREERALASTQEEPEAEAEASEESTKSEDKKETRKSRVNIAMAAIMRKQEETNKQVKFVTPPPTHDFAADANDSTSKDQEKPKVIQPKAIKSLANLPLGRKTGGILMLKDKSAGYPHLVKTDPEPPKKEKEDKKEPKSNQGSSQNSQQNYQQKRTEHQPTPTWSSNVPPPNTFNEPLRMNFQKNYGIQNTGISYNPSYPSPTGVNNQGIRLPVVNPKEIDVRTAALQKQNSRQELFQDGHKFGAHNYQISGDKKNFLNDLPPRFANQYKYWQTAQDNRFSDNKFRDDSTVGNNMFNPQQQLPEQSSVNWLNNPQIPDFQQPIPWWKPENPPPNLNTNFSSPQMTLQPNFYSHSLNQNLSNPYQNMPTYNQMTNQNLLQQSKPENVITPPNYLQSAIGQPQMQTLQNLVTSPNFNSSLTNFGSYAPTLGYDSSMYPQFGSNKLNYQSPHMNMPDKLQIGYQVNKDMGLSFGSNVLDMQQRMQFNEPLNADMGAVKNLDQVGVGGQGGSEAPGNTYSLFSGAPDNGAWGSAQRPPHQSLWSGPGPSPLERLLEQQKQMNQPPPPQ